MAAPHSPDAAVPAAAAGAPQLPHQGAPGEAQRRWQLPCPGGQQWWRFGAPQSRCYSGCCQQGPCRPSHWHGAAAPLPPFPPPRPPPRSNCQSRRRGQRQRPPLQRQPRPALAAATWGLDLQAARPGRLLSPLRQGPSAFWPTWPRPPGRPALHHLPCATWPAPPGLCPLDFCTRPALNLSAHHHHLMRPDSCTPPHGPPSHPAQSASHITSEPPPANLALCHSIHSVPHTTSCQPSVVPFK